MLLCGNTVWVLLGQLEGGGGGGCVPVYSMYVYSNDSFGLVIHCVVLRVNVSVV